jgi:tetratricopeptide (TPR) repeat protein
MKVLSFTSSRLCAVLVLLIFSAALACGAAAQEKGKPAQVSEGERKAAQKINEAKDAAAKIAAANDFIQKYPKSSLRPKIADLITDQIASTQDLKQKISLAETYMNTFTEASETHRMYPILIESYIKAKRIDDAFNAAGPWLELNPNEVDTFYLLAATGADEARRQNPKYFKQSQMYGLKAIELIAADKRPETYSVEIWNKNKAIWLPQLYQSMGLLAFLGGNITDAVAKLQKAVTLNPNDPFNFVLLVTIKNNEYSAEAKQLQGVPQSSARAETEKKLLTQLDEVIDLYAHAIGLMEGKPQYQQLHDQLLPSLEDYYKFRHNNSTAGMQELINEYKQPATP